MPFRYLSKTNFSFTPDLRFQDDFWWLPDGRLMYVDAEGAPNSRNTNLWQISVDGRSGNPQGQPQRLTNLTRLHIEGLSASADGRRLVFESGSEQSHVYVGRLEADGKLGSPRRLTLDERYNFPFAWTPDRRAVIFNSDRTGTFLIYKQALDQQVPELIATGPASTRIVRVSPDGKWLIYMVLSNADFPDRSEFIRLMRVPLAGGPPRLIFEMENTGFDFDCPRHLGAQCIGSQASADRKEHVFISFDPVSGARSDLFRIPTRVGGVINFTVSPDGSRIVMTGHDPKGRIEIRSLTGKVENRIALKGCLTRVQSTGLRMASQSLSHTPGW